MQCLVNKAANATHIYVVQYTQNCAWSGQGAVTSHFSFKIAQCLVNKKTVAAQNCAWSRNGAVTSHLLLKTAQCPVSEASGSIYLDLYT